MLLSLLKLLWMFFKIGLFTFGGGAAMIPLIKESLFVNGYDITSDFIDQLVGLAQSTPGPIAVNLATYIGMSQYGILGALFATLGVVLPSFIIILLIAKYGSKAIDSKIAQHAFSTLKPAVIGLIASVALTMTLSNIFPLMNLKMFDLNFTVSYQSIIIFAILFTIMMIFKKISPIKIILLSAVLGVIIYYIV